MNILGGGYGNSEQMAKCATDSPVNYRQRTLREQLQDRIATHQAQIDNLNDALNALTPDVEKALNALQKL